MKLIRTERTLALEKNRGRKRKVRQTKEEITEKIEIKPFNTVNESTVQTEPHNKINQKEIH